MADLVSRQEAKSMGMKTYFTGLPCKVGHVATRRVDSCKCIECVHAYNREARRSDVSGERRRRAEWREKNLERARSRDRGRQKKYRSLLHYQLSKFMRQSVWRLLKLGLDDKKSTSTERLLGYSWRELKEHLEKQFLPGMSWQNYGLWHIDHITPLTKFTCLGKKATMKANCLTNLRPVWAEENLRKGCAETFLI